MGQLHTHLQRWCITPPTSQRHDKHKGGVQCLQALYIVATSYHMTYSHQHTHIQLRQIHCTCTRVSLLAPVGRLEASTGGFRCLQASHTEVLSCATANNSQQLHIQHHTELSGRQQARMTPLSVTSLLSALRNRRSCAAARSCCGTHVRMRVCWFERLEMHWC